MKKFLSLILALAMLVTIVPAVAESKTTTTTTEASAEAGKLESLLGGLLNGSGESTEGGDLSSLLVGLLNSNGDSKEGSGLSSLLSGLFGGSDKGGFSLSSLLKPLMNKLKNLKGTRLSLIVSALKHKLSSLVNSLFSGLLGGISSRSTEGGESAGLSSLLGGLLGGSTEGTEGGEGFDLSGLLGLLGGSEEDAEDFDLDAFLEEYRQSPEYLEYVARYTAIEDYLSEEYSKSLEQGDVQIYSIHDVWNMSDDADPNLLFGYLALSNYKADGKGLKLMNYAGNVELLTIEKQDDGSFKVVNAIVADDGTDQAESIQKMCDIFGVTYEEYADTMLWSDYDQLAMLYDYLNEHSEYETIEYMGEMLTLEELNARMDAMSAEIRNAK